MEPEPEPDGHEPSSENELDTPTSEDLDRLFGSDSGSDDDDELLLLGPTLYQLRHAGLTPEFVSQAYRMPTAIRDLLVEGADPSSVAPSAVLDSLQMTGPERAAAEAEARCDLASAMLCQPHTLSAEACARLRDAVDAGLHNGEQCRGRDSVDHATEFQLNVTVAELAAIIGQDSVANLRLVAEDFVESAWDEEAQVFVRRYSGDSRPWIPFHTDTARVTLNVSLSDEAAIDGGELMVLAEGRVVALKREEGEATVHSSELMHAVARVSSAVRYSLIIFCGLALDEC